MSRDHLDRYWTQPWAVRSLLRRLDLAPGTRVLEPCVGRPQRIATVLREFGLEVVTNDLDAVAVADHHWDWPTEVALRPEQVRAAVGDVAWTVTNPPYKTASTTAAHFAWACLDVCPRLALLVRSGWLEVCGDREKLFAERPPCGLLALPRVAYDGPAIIESSGSPYGSIWVLWCPDEPGRPPIFDHVPKSEVDDLPREMMSFADEGPRQVSLWEGSA